MLNVKINENYTLESDARTFVVKYKILRNSRSGEGQNEYWGYLYFGKLEQALNNVLDQTLLMSDAVDLEALRQLILETKRDIMTVVESGELLEFMKRREEAYPTPSSTTQKLDLSQAVKKAAVNKIAAKKRGRGRK